MPDVNWTDDPRLPCSLCVGWIPDLDDEFGQRAFPVDIRGERITEMYSGIHPRCQESVDAYVAEHAGHEPF